MDATNRRSFISRSPRENLRTGIHRFGVGTALLAGVALALLMATGEAGSSASMVILPTSFLASLGSWWAALGVGHLIAGATGAHTAAGAIAVIVEIVVLAASLGVLLWLAFTRGGA
jgi:hypothetical protein